MSEQYDSREDNRRLLAALNHRHPPHIDPERARREAFLKKLGVVMAAMFQRWREFHSPRQGS